MGINSDRGTNFTSKLGKTLSKALGLQWKLHIPYQPQSSGMIEWVHGKIKVTLAKVCQQNRLLWPDNMPIVMYALGNQKNRNTGQTPHGMLMVWPMTTGTRPPMTAEKVALVWNDDISLRYAQAMCERVGKIFENVKQDRSLWQKEICTRLNQEIRFMYEQWIKSLSLLGGKDHVWSYEQHKQQ